MTEDGYIQIEKKHDEPDPVIAADDTVNISKRLERYMQITAAGTCLIVMAIAGLLLYYIRSIVIIFALAFLAAYILSPAIRFFERRRVPRLLVLSILYVVFVAIVVISIVLLLPVLWNELRELQSGIERGLNNPEFQTNMSAKIEAIKSRLAKAFPMLKNTDTGSQFNIDKGMSMVTSKALEYIGQLVAYSGRVIWITIVIILIPFVTFFLLKDGNSIKRVILRFIPSKHSEAVSELLQKIDRQIGRYIRGRLAESVILSVLTIIGLRILRIKYFLVIGGIAGFANLIPYIGPVMIGIPPVILAFYQFGMFRMVITGIFLGALQIVDNAILVPMVVGKSVDLHPALTIFVVFVGGQLLGFLGMIIAVPLASIIIAIMQTLYREFRSYSAS